MSHVHKTEERSNIKYCQMVIDSMLLSEFKLHQLLAVFISSPEPELIPMIWRSSANLFQRFSPQYKATFCVEPPWFDRENIWKSL